MVESLLAAAVVSVVVVISLMGLWRTSEYAIARNLERSLTQLAVALSASIDPSAFAELDAARDALPSARSGAAAQARQRCESALHRAAHRTPDVARIYAITSDPHGPTLVLDPGSSDGWASGSVSGRAMDEPLPGLPDSAYLGAIGADGRAPRPTAMTVPRKVVGGDRVTGYAPITGPRGELLGVMAVDLDPADFQAQLHAARWALALGVAPASLLVAGVGIGVFILRKRQLLSLVAATEGRRRAIAAARRLAESERRFRTLADDAPMMIWSSDAEGQVDFVSRVWSQFAGRPPETDLGDGWLESVHPEDRARCERSYRRAIERRRSFIAEYRARRADGQTRWILGKGVPRHDDDGAFAGLIGVAVDITELRRAESDLKRATRAAQSADRAKSEFLANMSHEIRTPLTTILGYADLLREDGDAHRAPPQRLQAIDLIRLAGRHLLTILNDVLDLSKIEAGEMNIEIVDTDLPRLLAECLDLMRFAASGRGVALHLEMDTPLPIMVRTDPTRLRQVLLNLLGNAVKFTEQGTVTLRCGMDGDALVVDVEDTGVGMSPEQASRLFQPFAQADPSVARTHGGTGLGLAISRRLATLMGGSVMLLRTEEGVGSCFRARLEMEVPEGSRRLADRAALASYTSRNDAMAPTGRIPPLRGRILVAEDGRENRQLITIHLERAGAQVTSAEDGRAALRLVEDAHRLGRPFDLLLTDLQMPEMDGLTLVRTLRSRGESMPIVALTAHDLGEDRQRCIDAGCDDFASKPIERSTLLSACAKWLAPQARAATHATLVA